MQSGRGWEGPPVPVLGEEDLGAKAGGGRSAGVPRLQAVPTPTTVPYQTEQWGHAEVLRATHLGSVPAGWGDQACVRVQGLGGCSLLAPGLIWPLSQTPPQVRPFHQEDFLCSLEQAGPQLTCILKGDWLGLYRWVDASAGPGLLLLVGTQCPCPTCDGVSPTAVASHSQAVLQVPPL